MCSMLNIFITSLSYLLPIFSSLFSFSLFFENVDVETQEKTNAMLAMMFIKRSKLALLKWMYNWWISTHIPYHVSCLAWAITFVSALVAIHAFILHLEFKVSNLLWTMSLWAVANSNWGITAGSSSSLKLEVSMSMYLTWVFSTMCAYWMFLVLTCVYILNFQLTIGLKSSLNHCLIVWKFQL